MNFNTRMGVSSHMPVLLKVFSKTKGPILELGGGIYSTPLLHWLCFDAKRKLATYETDLEYYHKALKQYNSDFHTVNPIADWSKIPTKGWKVVFIDNLPKLERKENVKRFKDADYIIIHDTNPNWDYKYRYSEIFSLFKYRKDFKEYGVWTTVLSNRKKVGGL